jgi:hypothetical protein
MIRKRGRTPGKRAADTESESEGDQSARNRKVTRTQQVTTAVDKLLDSSRGNSRKYIDKHLDAASTEIIVFMANMFRTGWMSATIERLGNAAATTPLGGRLKTIKTKKGLLFSHLGRRFDREFVDMVCGREVFPEGTGSAKVMTTKIYRQLVAFALNVDPNTACPKMHQLSEFEGPMVESLKHRYTAMGSRLAKLTHECVAAHVYFEYLPALQTIRYILDPKITLELSEIKDFIDAHSDWKILHASSLHRAILQSDESGQSVKLLPLLNQQFPKLKLVDEMMPFEYPASGDELHTRLKFLVAPKLPSSSSD